MPYEGHYARKAAQKAAQKAANELPQNTEISSASANVQADSPVDSPEETIGKTENFFTNHVKLITFLICVFVFLAACGPWGIPYLIKEETPDATERLPQITEAKMLELAACGDALTWKHFNGFAYETRMDKQGLLIRQYPVEGDRYAFYVSAESSTSPLSSVILTDTKEATSTELIEPTQTPEP